MLGLVSKENAPCIARLRNSHLAPIWERLKPNATRTNLVGEIHTVEHSMYKTMHKQTLQ